MIVDKIATDPDIYGLRLCDDELSLLRIILATYLDYHDDGISSLSESKDDIRLARVLYNAVDLAINGKRQ